MGNRKDANSQQIGGTDLHLIPFELSFQQAAGNSDLNLRFFDPLFNMMFNCQIPKDIFP
jgi:hypothetical protein